MAEMKISNAPLRLTLKDDRGRVVAALRYPRVKWKNLVIESEDAEFDAVVLSGTRVRLEKRAPASDEGAESGNEGQGRPSDWDPFHEVEYGVRDFLTKAGKAMEDFLEDLNEWSGPFARPKDESEPEEETE